jgi:nicotinamide-nucleotide amidase
MRRRAATLAIGTEVSDGQIVDRNSCWIAQRLVGVGIEVIEHRAVPDDRAHIKNALSEIGPRVDLLFVTGGLGPTSDDFTRDALAEFFNLETEFDPASWAHIEERFAARGIAAKPMQRQQCYFPKGATIFKNAAGTANAFMFENEPNGSGTEKLKVYALPGPPMEIATIWNEHLKKDLESLIPIDEREKLFLLRTLGKGESDIAEQTELILAQAPKNLGIRVGYRAHQPYVEVKVWYPIAHQSEVEPILKQLETTLSEWIVCRGDEDLIDVILERMARKAPILIGDSASNGLLQSRLLQRLEDQFPNDDAPAGRYPMTITSHILGTRDRSASNAAREKSFAISFDADLTAKNWRLSLLEPDGREHDFVIEPTPIYAFGSLRGRKYATERALHMLSKWPFDPNLSARN